MESITSKKGTKDSANISDMGANLLSNSSQVAIKDQRFPSSFAARRLSLQSHINSSQVFSVLLPHRGQGHSAQSKSSGASSRGALHL
jgi:hypothetical protein